MLTMAGIGAAVAPFLEEGQWTNTTAGVFTFYLVASAWATVRRPEGQAGRFERVAVAVPIGIALLGLVMAFVGPATGRTAGFATVYVIGLLSLVAASGDLKLIRRGGRPNARRSLRRANSARTLAISESSGVSASRPRPQNTIANTATGVIGRKISA